MPARVLSIPIVLVLMTLLYLSWEISEEYAYWLPAPVILLSVIYVLSPQINWWWYVRHTPELEGPFRRLLLEHHPYYARLSVADKKRFRERVFLFRLAQDFMPKGWERVPDDVRTVLATQAVSLTFGWKDFLLAPYEKVVVYPHRFPSPRYPEHLHASEVHHEDAVLLFSADAVMRGAIPRTGAFNVALYEYAKVVLRVHEAFPWPEEDPDWWDGLRQACRYDRAALGGYLGLPETEVALLPACMVAFLYFPDRMGAIMPDLSAQLAAVLRFDPGRAEREKEG